MRVSHSKPAHDDDGRGDAEKAIHAVKGPSYFDTLVESDRVPEHDDSHEHYTNGADLVAELIRLQGWNE